MSKDKLKTIDDIISFGSDVSFDEFKSQLVKDLQLVGISILPDESQDSYEKLYSWFSSVCQHLIERDFQGYLNLLYRIDVSAEKFIHLNETNTEVDSNEIAASLVFNREMSKILLRKKYS
jgi:hypothetical protein